MDNSKYELLTKEQAVEKYDNLFTYATQLENELETAKQEIEELKFENSNFYDEGFSEGKDYGYSEGYDDGVQAALDSGDKDERF